MNANEMISCALYNDVLRVTAFRRNGKVVASAYKIEAADTTEEFAIAEGRIEFKDENDLTAFAKDTIMPCIAKMHERQNKLLPHIRISSSICDMSIGLEPPTHFS